MCVGRERERERERESLEWRMSLDLERAGFASMAAGKTETNEAGMAVQCRGGGAGQADRQAGV